MAGKGKRVMLILKDYKGDVKAGDNIQINKWTEKNSEAKEQVGYGTVEYISKREISDV
ncbi:MAG: hypothetical protein IMF13_00555 [Proteobacteria bacterium]|nr:hypothetical protein [Pseudomonadota bacterium]